MRYKGIMKNVIEQLTLDIKREEEIPDLWEFDNFDWLTGNPDNLKEFFTEAIPRLEKMIVEYPRYADRYKKLKEDCVKRLNNYEH